MTTTKTTAKTQWLIVLVLAVFTVLLIVIGDFIGCVQMISGSSAWCEQIIHWRQQL